MRGPIFQRWWLWVPAFAGTTAGCSSLRRLRHLIGDADRAAHAGAAQAAIAHRVLRQILLVVVLGKIERRRIEDFGGDRIEVPRFELLLVHRFRRLRGATLLGGERVDA